MFEKKYHLYLTKEERNQIIGSLVELRNSLIRSGKYTDLVDETLCKLTEAKIKKVRLHIKKQYYILMVDRFSLSAIFYIIRSS